ncbi:MAG: c-type cytochrome, partial [Chloroflexi bacterium]|nr:c-type cytochrome [Chloroflexota bacterium]
MQRRLSLDETDLKLLLGLALTLGIVLVLSFVILYEPTRAARTRAAFTAEAVERGEDLFAANCVACHGSEGKGDGETPAPALNDSEFLGSVSDQEIRETLTFGRPGTAMVAFSAERGGILREDEIGDLVAFVRHWQPQAQAVPTPTPRVVAEAVYAARCTGCHGLAGAGTAELPLVLRSLAYLGGATDAEIRQQMQSGKPAIGMPACGSDLSEAELDALVALVKGWREALPAVSDGAVLFERYCTVCHGANGQGTAEVPLVLHSGAFLGSRSDVALRQSIVEGHGAMPPWGQAAGGLMTDEQVDGLVQRLRSWGGEALTPAAEADPLRGAEAFAARCASCHGELGRGGVIVEEPVN